VVKRDPEIIITIAKENKHNKSEIDINFKKFKLLINAMNISFIY
jgi:hypothetical protein